MTALSAERAGGLKRDYPPALQREPIGLAADTKIWNGALVAINTAGEALPAVNTTNYKCVGIATATVDNTGGAAGAKKVTCEYKHIYRLKSSGLTAADIDKIVYVTDDQTVTTTAGNGVKTGRVYALDGADHVWVEILGDQA